MHIVCKNCNKEMKKLSKFSMRRYNNVENETNWVETVELVSFIKEKRKTNSIRVQTDIYVCPECGKLETYIPKDIIDLVLDIEDSDRCSKC